MEKKDKEMNNYSLKVLRDIFIQHAAKVDASREPFNPNNTHGYTQDDWEFNIARAFITICDEILEIKRIEELKNTENYHD